MGLEITTSALNPPKNQEIDRISSGIVSPNLSLSSQILIQLKISSSSSKTRTIAPVSVNQLCSHG